MKNILLKIEWNKVTWYSKLTAVALFLFVLLLGFHLGILYQDVAEVGRQEASEIMTALTLVEQIIKSNFFAISIGGIIAGFFSFWQYRKQKVWENIERRYFMNGIEELIRYLNEMRTTLEHNYSQALLILKYFRDYDEKHFLQWIELARKTGVRSDSKVLSAKMPDALLVTLRMLENKHFARLSSGIFPQIMSLNDFLISDITIGLEIFANSSQAEKKIEKKELIGKTEEELRKRWKSVKEMGLYEIITVLEDVLDELRKFQPSSYREIEKISKNKRVQEILGRLEKIEVPLSRQELLSKK